MITGKALLGICCIWVACTSLAWPITFVSKVQSFGDLINNFIIIGVNGDNPWLRCQWFCYIVEKVCYCYFNICVRYEVLYYHSFDFQAFITIQKPAFDIFKLQVWEASDFFVCLIGPWSDLVWMKVNYHIWILRIRHLWFEIKIIGSPCQLPSVSWCQREVGYDGWLCHFELHFVGVFS